jgi:hypothetical protein
MLSPDALLSLREILRARRELPADEVTRLLQPLPPLIDADEAGSAASLINEVFVQFDAPPPGGLAPLAKRPASEWPAYTLHFSPGDEQDAGSTIVGGISLYAAYPVTRLAALLYELLGGRIRSTELMRGKYSPLAELDETANLLLRKGLTRGAFPDCCSFWREWVELILPGGAGLAEAPTWRIGDSFLSAGQPGECLDLTPVDTPAVPTRLVARAVFRIGRSRRLSDLPTRSATETGTGQSIKELSRVHVIAERGDDVISLRDGNGERGSANGATWNGTELASDVPTPIRASGMLILSATSCRFRIEIVPFPHNRFGRVEIANLDRWRAATEPVTPLKNPFTAVAFRHPRGAMVVRQPLWLLSATGAEVHANGEFTWNEADNASHVFLHRHGCFWLVNNDAKEPVRVGEHPLNPGETAPLDHDGTIQLGGVTFRLTLS